MHSVFAKLEDSIAAIWASRSITMASTSTRRAPNCFNHLHQLRKLEALGASAGNDTIDWNCKAGVMKAFNVGPAEAAAAMNLAKGVPLEFVYRLQKLVEKCGFARGPLTHTALALDSICLGKGPTLACPRWTADLKNDEYSLHLLGLRIELDWGASPKSMRKALLPQQMAQKQLLCATFNKAKKTLQATIPDVAFQTEFPLLEDKFLQQHMDLDLERAAENMQDPWRMTELNDFVAVIKRLEVAVAAKERERHREVTLRAEAATFDQLSTELAMDQADAAKYLERRAALGKAWELSRIHL